MTCEDTVLVVHSKLFFLSYTGGSVMVSACFVLDLSMSDIGVFQSTEYQLKLCQLSEY